MACDHWDNAVDQSQWHCATKACSDLEGGWKRLGKVVLSKEGCKVVKLYKVICSLVYIQPLADHSPFFRANQRETRASSKTIKLLGMQL